MKVFGLTGGIGMGKSTAAELLRWRGVPVVDTDTLAREVVEPGEPALTEVREAFGAEVIGGDGRLRRGELARRVFSDAAALKRLEGILHPRIRKLWQEAVARWREAGEARCVVVIPLLFETGASVDMNATICLACTAMSQRERLLARGWSEEQIAGRLRAQWPVEKKMELADHVIWTEGSLDVLAEQLGHVVS